jgi:hypothetical protein
VLVASVVIAVLAFEVWFFFFFSSSPIDQRTGPLTARTGYSPFRRSRASLTALRSSSRGRSCWISR